MTMPHEQRPCDNDRAPAGSLPQSRLPHDARSSLRGTSAYARLLSDRFELISRTTPEALSRVSDDIAARLLAVCEAFDDLAHRTLWMIDPELAHKAQQIATMERDRLGPPSGDPA